MIHRGCHRIAMQVTLGLLDRAFIELNAAIHAGRGAAGGEQVFGVREAFRVSLSQFLAERIIHYLIIVQATVSPLNLMDGNKVESVLVERNLNQHAAVLLKAEFIKLFHERLKAGWNDCAEHAIHLAISNLTDGGRVFWLIERIVFLKYYFATVGLD